MVIGNLLPFPSSFCNGTTMYVAETVTVGPAGGVGASYPNPPTGPVVRASVQPGTDSRKDEDGIIRYFNYFTVNLLDDPSALNGGKGVKRGDAFLWSGDPRLLIAQVDAVKIGSVWPVRCLANQ